MILERLSSKSERMLHNRVTSSYRNSLSYEIFNICDMPFLDVMCLSATLMQYSLTLSSLSLCDHSRSLPFEGEDTGETNSSFSLSRWLAHIAYNVSLSHTHSVSLAGWLALRRKSYHIHCLSLTHTHTLSLSLAGWLFEESHISHMNLYE